jgi:hypothetical protein
MEPKNNASSTQQSGTIRQTSIPNRYVFEYNGQKTYEFDQSLEEVNIYIQTPPGEKKWKACDFEIKILVNQLRVGLNGHDRYFIDEMTFGKVDTSESSWYIDDSIIHILLIKASRGSIWDTPLMGRDLATNCNGKQDSNSTVSVVVDPATKEKITQELMLERFQEENPGFDFRDAEFNGAVPDPRTFMGGIKYD